MGDTTSDTASNTEVEKGVRILSVQGLKGEGRRG